MKKILVLILIGLTANTYLVSCKKTKNATSTTNSFMWTFKGNNYSATMDTAYLSSRSVTPIIIAAIGTNLRLNTRVAISLSSFNIGAYNLGTNNTLYYIDDQGNSLNPLSGTVTITANTNNLLSGTFTATLADISGSQNPVAGNFTNVTIRP